VRVGVKEANSPSPWTLSHRGRGGNRFVFWMTLSTKKEVRCKGKEAQVSF